MVNALRRCRLNLTTTTEDEAVIGTSRKRARSSSSSSAAEPGGGVGARPGRADPAPGEPGNARPGDDDGLAGPVAPGGADQEGRGVVTLSKRPIMRVRGKKNKAKGYKKAGGAGESEGGDTQDGVKKWMEY